MIYYSSEIRWFSDKASPLIKMYNSFPGKGGAAQERTDHYLNRNSESIGIKIREGKMEVKLMIDAHPYHFKRHRWLTENWVKCSYEDKASGLKKLGAIATEQITWLDIYKKRKQKKFKISGSKVSPVSFDERIDQGCLMEYTSLKVVNKIPYYTFGFEAFGKDTKSSDTNLKVMLEYSEDYIAPKVLKEMICGGYAKLCTMF